jgi:hypothetical protein
LATVAHRWASVRAQGIPCEERQTYRPSRCSSTLATSISKEEVLEHPAVIESQLGTDESTINRSGVRI